VNHKYLKHENCELPHCNICDGGLAVCVVCGGAEGKLTTDCCGYKLNSNVLNEVYLGDSDYKDGSWIFKKKGV
jgi:hypothetical protein